MIRFAHSLIRDKAHWCRQANAQTSLGILTNAYSSSAVKFCALGAVWRAHKELGSKASLTDVLAQLNTVSRELYGEKLNSSAMSSLENVNDHLGHAAVMKVFTAALWGAGL